MEWKGRRLLTLGDWLVRGLDACDSPEEAQTFMQQYRAENPNADEHVRELARLYPPDISETVLSWFLHSSRA